MGNPTSDSDLYNDHLGNLDVLPGINPHWVNSNSTLQNWRVTQLAGYPSTKTGYSLLWNSGIPNWMTQQEPEITVGRSLFTGYDIDNPLMKRSWSTILRGVAPVIGGHKAVDMGVILSNEPHWFSEQGHWTQNYGEMNAISSYTLEKFRQWLNDKYSGSIASLNENWSTQFSHFDAIQFSIPIDPATRGTPVWYDWCRFNMDRVVSWFSFLQGELHAVDSSIDTSIKIMPDLFTENNRSHGIDLEALTNLTTMIGDDAKTRKRDLRSTEPEHWEEHYAYFWEELAVSYDFMESVSPGKIHVNSEAHFLSSSWWRELSVSPAYVRNTYWLATILGMDASMSWFWARDPDGSPEQRLEGDLEFFDPAMAGAFAASVNMQPQVANELAQTMFDLNAYSEEVMALRNQRRPVRLFYSETSAINKTAHMTDQFEIYESLFFEGFPVGYATQNIIENQDSSNWDVVVVYKTPFVTDAEFAALQAYLNTGGTVILDSTASLSKNEYGQNRASSLVAGQGTLHVMGVSAQVDEIKQQVLSSLTNSASGVLLTESNGLSHKGCVWRVVPKAEGGYLMTVINLGKNTAQLQVSMTDQTQLKAVDLLTGTQLGSEFELVSEGVLLLELVSL
ncbi:beta-galactosidase [Microbulbifer elongatus]|uniref:Beta-galactosidase n=1 Tax=Microbulbifer elongatus TaxID=86173 RepID=A0ABT1P4H3_9GAMM|nr:alpha-amylase family protein [Microbulbifer elongatus]MCQ3831003.1 beta-galactosidase [Microbulbifer elongatus]